jgi:hypothetical protein
MQRLRERHGEILRDTQKDRSTNRKTERDREAERGKQKENKSHRILET